MNNTLDYKYFITNKNIYSNNAKSTIISTLYSELSSLNTTNTLNSIKCFKEEIDILKYVSHKLKIYLNYNTQSNNSSIYFIDDECNVNANFIDTIDCLLTDIFRCFSNVVIKNILVLLNSLYSISSFEDNIIIKLMFNAYKVNNKERTFYNELIDNIKNNIEYNLVNNDNKHLNEINNAFIFYFNNILNEYNKVSLSNNAITNYNINTITNLSIYNVLNNIILPILNFLDTIKKYTIEVIEGYNLYYNSELNVIGIFNKDNNESNNIDKCKVNKEINSFNINYTRQSVYILLNKISCYCLLNYNNLDVLDIKNINTKQKLLNIIINNLYNYIIDSYNTWFCNSINNKDIADYELTKLMNKIIQINSYNKNTINNIDNYCNINNQCNGINYYTSFYKNDSFLLSFNNLKRFQYDFNKFILSSYSNSHIIIAYKKLSLKLLKNIFLYINLFIPFKSNDKFNNLIDNLLIFFNDMSKGIFNDMLLYNSIYQIINKRNKLNNNFSKNDCYFSIEVNKDIIYTKLKDMTNKRLLNLHLLSYWINNNMHLITIKFKENNNLFSDIITNKYISIFNFFIYMSLFTKLVSNTNYLKELNIKANTIDDELYKFFYKSRLITYSFLNLLYVYLLYVLNKAKHFIKVNTLLSLDYINLHLEHDKCISHIFYCVNNNIINSSIVRFINLVNDVNSVMFNEIFKLKNYTKDNNVIVKYTLILINYNLKLENELTSFKDILSEVYNNRNKY